MLTDCNYCDYEKFDFIYFIYLAHDNTKKSDPPRHLVIIVMTRVKLRFYEYSFLYYVCFFDIGKHRTRSLISKVRTRRDPL